MIKKILKSVTPPVLWWFFGAVGHRVLSGNAQIRWSQGCVDWRGALLQSDGYDPEKLSKNGLDKFKQVLSGQVKFERDTVLFYREELNFPLLSAIGVALAHNTDTLNLVDFGGGFASQYFQNRSILQHGRLKWTVIEQAKLVQDVQTLSLPRNLKFRGEISSEETKGPSFLLLSGVLQYLETPDAVLADLVKKLNPDYIFFDRTPFYLGSGHKLTVQHVPEWIYKASYPCWFFDQKLLELGLEQQYEKLFELNTNDKCNDFDSVFKAIFWKRKGL